MQAFGKRKVKLTCIGIVVLHILRTCGIVDDEDIVLSDSDKSVEEVTSPRSAEAPLVQVLSSSTSPNRVLDPSPSSSNPQRVQDPSSRSPEPVQASPTRRDRQHSPESSPRTPNTLSDHATRNGSDTTPDRESTGPSDNEPLIGFGLPMVPYPPTDDDEEVAIVGLTSLGASDSSIAAKGRGQETHCLG
ncbi:hypothetical protein R1sor_009754 [Riccia sorocarpa]|uniref:Uncharacterized protein n=1 Tax=Riccia sorocarpa TaxID=122646 RepID=A0ABD3HWA3_9MARC